MSDKNSQPYLKCKDYSVSGETFELRYNETYDMLETYPVPDVLELGSYYESDNYISHTDTKRNLFEKVYHMVRSYALLNKLKLIYKYSKNGKRLLDIGCGTGDFLNTAKQADWEVTGIEPNESARTIAKEKVGDVVFDVDELERLEEGSFDVITLWHVLEHLPNLNEQIQILNRLLKPTGTLIIAVPNYKSFDAKHYKEFWAAYDVPRHLWHFSQTSIKRLFMGVGMRVEKILPMTFDSFYVSLLSEKHKTGKMHLVIGFLNGLRSNFKALRTGEYSSLIYVIKNE
ncbi:class I SAM-dependent methyltransferase [Mangrovimonas aestuarii]|uniref:class I SAM-dependent methyltransferase n=1 Tax=Mangrovimonas aestuarii TaxID=3018443 RepID=UPI00237817E8|nr:class I SAM-dependent methyltransferase [Mangrovimonas aestuarii]